MNKDKIISLLIILALVLGGLNIYQYATYQGKKVVVGYSKSKAAPNKPIRQGSKGSSNSSGTSLTVISPNGGESWIYGSTQIITWSASASVANVDISVVAAGSPCTSGSACTPTVKYALAQQVPNTGTYTWVITQPSGNSYQVWITDSADPATEDLSDQVFSITPPPTNATITLKANQASVSAGSAASFTATITDLPYPITWFFGDATGAAEPCVVAFGGTSCTNITSDRIISISHAYNAVGTYGVLVTGSSNGNAISSNAVLVQVK